MIVLVQMQLFVILQQLKLTNLIKGLKLIFSPYFTNIGGFMALKGKSTRIAVPYIPEVERDTVQPTIFWLFPKNMKGTYKSLSLYVKANPQIQGKGNKELNDTKMMEADEQDFLLHCDKVENYQFGEDFPELSAKGIIAEITDAKILTLIPSDINPQIIQEVQQAMSNWENLDASRAAYDKYLASKK